MVASTRLWTSFNRRICAGALTRQAAMTTSLILPSLTQ
jgi:hypothetical protein